MFEISALKVGRHFEGGLEPGGAEDRRDDLSRPVGPAD
jgi:hypothetical protein